MDPRLTVSGQILPESTGGAAGGRLATAIEISTTATTPSELRITLFLRFFRFTDSSTMISITLTHNASFGPKPPALVTY
jgi:hypothetical protein